MQGDKIVVVGNSSGYLVDVVRLNNDGTLDNSFDGDGKQTIDFGIIGSAGYGVAMQGDKIVVVGVSVQVATETICS